MCSKPPPRVTVQDPPSLKDTGRSARLDQAAPTLRRQGSPGGGPMWRAVGFLPCWQPLLRYTEARLCLQRCSSEEHTLASQPGHSPQPAAGNDAALVPQECPQEPRPRGGREGGTEEGCILPGEIQ